MSIYLAAFAPPGSANPHFKQRGISDHTDTELQSLQIKGVSNARMIAYDGYKSNIDIFVAASNRQMRISTSTEGALLSNTSRPLVPLDHPPVCFMLNVKMAEDQQVALLARLKDYLPERRTVGKTILFVLAKPSFDIYDRLTQIASEKPAHTQGAVNLHAYGAYLKLLRVVSEFLATNSYPAHRSEEADNQDVALLENADFSMSYSTSSKHVRSKSPQPSSLAVPGAEDVNMSGPSASPEPKVKTIVTLGPSHSAVFVAKPSPIPASINFGPTSAIPFLPGRAFPYFGRMIRPSPLFIKQTFTDHFLRTLGDSREEQFKQLKLLKSGIDSLAGSPEGQVLAHIFYGIKLALDTQTRLFLVIDRGYCGFVLLGARWSVFDGKQWLQPESDEELSLTVASMSSHRAAVASLAAKLSSLNLVASLPASVKRPVAIDEITSGMALLRLILERKVEDDDKEEMSRPLGMVVFAKPYKQITSDNLVWLLEQLTIKADEPLPVDLNVYVTPTLNNIEDRVYQVLAAFGSDAPSFRNATGSIFPIPPIEAKVDPNELVDQTTGKKALPHLLVGPKSIQVAYNDMKKVLKDRSIQMDLRERAGANRTVAFYGVNRDVVYKSLKECVGAKVVVAEEVKGKKRKADDDEAGSRRVRAATAADVLALF